MEIDPVIQRALQLLVSRKPDSTEKLKQMLFDSLGREYVPPTKKAAKLQKQKSHSGDSLESLDDDDEANDMEAETDCSTDVGGASNDDMAVNADVFALDLGISCVVCSQFEVSTDNQLLECKECHNLYHQLCHKPVVSEGPVDDDSKFVCCNCSSSSSSKALTDKVKTSKAAEVSSAKSESGGTFKKPEKSDKSSGESSKDKKTKSEKKVKEKHPDKNKGNPEKEKNKKHKSSDKEAKLESSSRKEKAGSKSGESAKSSSSSSSSSKNSSSSGSKSSSGTTSSSSNSRDKTSSSSSDHKHKRSDAPHDKEKKTSKVKKERSE